jgi:hypothetical protein
VLRLLKHLMICVCGILFLAAPVLRAEDIFRHPRPQDSLESRWAWAKEKARTETVDAPGYWIGYTIKRFMGENTYYVTRDGSNYSTVTAPWRLRGGATLEELVSGRSSPRVSDEESLKKLAKAALEDKDTSPRKQKKVWKDIALLLGFETQASKFPARISFSSLDVPVDLRGGDLFWLGSASDMGSLGLIRGLYAQHTDEAQKKRLISAAGTHSDSQMVVPFLAEVLQGGEGEELRGRAASELEDHPVARSLELLRDTAFRDGSLYVRKRAVSALEDLDMEGAVDVLIQLARLADHIDIRKRAISTLGDLASGKAAKALVEVAYQDPEVSIRRRAVHALEDLPDNQGIPYLIKIARTHPEPAVRKSAIHCLGDSDDPRALDALIAIVKHR